MEAFRKSIKRRIMMFAGMTLLGAAFSVYGFLTMEQSKGLGTAGDAIPGFQYGIALSLTILAGVQTIRYSIAMRDQKKLRLLYHQEHDERLKMIRSKAGMPMLMITSILMLIAAMIAGYFNIIVFYTLIITALAQMTISTVIKFYYMKKM